MREFKVIGHRGACAHEPENTLRSVRRAIADRADMVEIDVRFAGGEIIVIHDDSVDRTTDGSGSVYEKPIDELRALDAGKGEKIPTLAEVLAITLGTLPLNIEIKDREATAPVCALLGDHSDLDLGQIVLSSFHAEAMIEARERLPQIPIGILSGGEPIAGDGMFRLADKLGAISVHPHIDSVTKELVAQAHARGVLILPYTARTSNELLELVDCGADGCFADDPKWAAELSDRHARDREAEG